MKTVKRGLLGVAIAAIVAAGGFLAYQELFPGELPGVEQQALEGRTHLAAGETFTYASATPTSGPHSASGVGCGVQTGLLPLELAVHALEHGTVVIWYQEGLDSDSVDALRGVVGEYDHHVILAMNPDLDNPIVVTAWGRRQTFDSVGDGIGDFIDTYRERGPERVPCDY